MSAQNTSYAGDEELVAQFLEWTGSAMLEMRDIVNGMADTEAKDADTSTRLYDLSHNIKGMGASFDFQLMTSVGTSLCKYIKTADGDLSKRVIDAHVRAFEVVLEHKIKGDGGEKGAALESRLAAIIAEAG
ncbi:MAG: Hpt domain-containing protein [Alphaproteobacteria bacterium]|nr:Hpt domain-containing protein [Alphaproteobacteria bacterium]